MSPMDNNIAKNEIAHGERLARGNPEDAWGWSTPAGKKRALRRALMIMESAGLGAESSVLEIGCGTGLFTEYFSRCGANIVAVDISHELIARAREGHLPTASGLLKVLSRNVISRFPLMPSSVLPCSIISISM